MALFKFHISACGSTTIRIQADDEDAANAVFFSGEWRADDPYWDSYEIDDVEEIEG